MLHVYNRDELQAHCIYILYSVDDVQGFISDTRSWVKSKCIALAKTHGIEVGDVLKSHIQ